MAETATAKKIEERESEEEIISTEDISPKRLESARDFLIDFKKTQRLEKIALARRLGLGDSGRTLVSKFLDDKLADKADPTRIVLAAEALRAQIEGPEGINKSIGVRETRCAQVVWRQAKSARDGHLMSAIVGPIGAGKTEALKIFQRRSSRDGGAPVRYIRGRTTVHLAALVRKVAVEMGITERGGDPAALHEDIVRRLMGYPEFLIFDEVDYFNERCLQFVRDLYDETGTGILLSGQLHFLTFLDRHSNGHGPSSSDDANRWSMSGWLAPFADRLFVQVAPGLDDDEVTQIAEETLNMELTEDAAAKLVTYVNHNFRLLARLIIIMREMRLRAGKTVDHRTIEIAWQRSQHQKAKN
jgi:DNA transposition AAA+ family ATPase